MSAMTAAETPGFLVNGRPSDLPERGKIGADNEVAPATLATPGDPANPDTPESTMRHRTARAVRPASEAP